ncbi:unnamed protein product [Hydatigera taeniaeformis]|uniref:ANK_REP_REGION domain-containing protein n=1 Tax=Hydatigena taeniaeformis TaxID=6205 RepID=A0A158RDC2_HYDTA|nr:unnamed protein product [Hydatigera taeniaeformis]
MHANIMATSIDSVARTREKEKFAELLTSNKGATSPNDRDKDGNSLTHLAALHGNVPLLCFLLENDIIEMEARNALNQTPLFFAVLSSSIETVRLFLEAGASFDVADANGETVVHISAKVNNLDITEFISTVGTNLNCVNAMGESALHVACRLNNLSSVIALSAAGVNPNTISNDQLSPLHLAAKSGDLELVRGLLFYGADSASPNGLGITADVTAYALGHNDVGKLITSITPERLVKFREKFEPLAKKPRIKLKLFGSSLSGKTALSTSLRSGVVTGYLKRKMKAISHIAEWLSEGETNIKYINISKRKTKMFYAEHDNYTRGIDIKSQFNDVLATLSAPDTYYPLGESAVSTVWLDVHDDPVEITAAFYNSHSCFFYSMRLFLSLDTPEFSIWEYSGYKPYYFLYYFFIGNTSCIHAVVYSLKDPPSVQREKVSFWLTFIHSRLPMQEGWFAQKFKRIIKSRMEIPTVPIIAEVISNRLEEWNRAHYVSIKYWPQFIHLVQTRINPLCTEAILRETVQFLQYTGDLIVLETEDENDLIILNPSWILTEAVGNLFSQDSISHARVTGSFTTDDLHFLITESDVDMVVEVLTALECCTVCQQVKDNNDGVSGNGDNLLQLEVRKQSIHSFFEDAVAGTTLETSQAEELQLEIPRLNLIQPSDLEEVWGSGKEMLRTGVQFRASGAQLIHLFPRIQCRLRRAVTKFSEQEGLEGPELVQWLHGSRLTFNKALINICLVCEETEEAIEVKLETHSSLTLLAFSCFHDTIILVRTALDEIVPQLSISNCLLIFKITTSRICKEVVSQPTIFHLLTTDSGTFTLLEGTLFLRNPQLRSCCYFGDRIPSSWIRDEVLLGVCSQLDNDDSLSETQLRDLSCLLNNDPQSSSWVELSSHDNRLNRLLQMLVDWRDCSGDVTVGRLISSLQTVGLTAISTLLQESLPVFVMKDPIATAVE